jgi:FHA domain
VAQPPVTRALAPAGAVAAGLFDGIQSLFAQAMALVEAGHQRAPVLMLVLAIMLVVPVIAVVSLTIHRMTGHKARQAAIRAAQRRAEAAGEWNSDTLTVRTIPTWSSQAWLTIEGRPNGTVPLAGQTIRIGRHADNDIRLSDSSVHRYHAVIERTPEDEFIITDLSGNAGNGIRINGERTDRARLADGDLIELGRARLKFENAPV